MSESGFHYWDIVFFAMVAAFLVLRLRSVLGRRTGNERPRPDPLARHPAPAADNVTPLNARPRGPVIEGAAAEVQPEHGPAAAGLARLKVQDSRFNKEDFLRGARGAFEMIVTAYAAGDVDTLKPLLSEEVLHNFTAAIDARAKAGETLQTTIVGFKSVEIGAADVSGTKARLTVKVVTEQVNLLRDATGAPVPGHDGGVIEVTDLWTFARDTRSSNPNWVLVATDVPE